MSPPHKRTKAVVMIGTGTVETREETTIKATMMAIMMTLTGESLLQEINNKLKMPLHNKAISPVFITNRTHNRIVLHLVGTTLLLKIPTTIT